jgi:hypothetical protein
VGIGDRELRSRPPNRLAVFVLALLGAMNCAAASADTYQREGFRFDVPDTGLEEIQSNFLAAALLVGSDWDAGVRPVVARWQRPPCFQMMDASDDEAASLEESLGKLSEAIGLQIVARHRPPRRSLMTSRTVRLMRTDEAKFFR